MMNKIRKRKYNHELRGLHFALSVIMYYISAHIRGICLHIWWVRVASGRTDNAVRQFLHGYLHDNDGRVFDCRAVGNIP